MSRRRGRARDVTDVLLRARDAATEDELLGTLLEAYRARPLVELVELIDAAGRRAAERRAYPARTLAAEQEGGSRR
ncbi:MAG TPA: hypothetical protein VFQ53_43370 [Kofleriaceae bacterium]|nr:hypothetical protein [Kofleriaceae bacterium]